MDEHPFIELIERHTAAIERVCRSFCSVKEDREDLRQDILLHLWQGWSHQGRQVSTVPLEAFDLPDDDALREQAAHLRAMMARLPLADQRLLRLYLDGFSSAEIGQMLGLSQTNVTTRIGRAKEKLKIMNEI